MTCADAQKIKQQVEFYFSDANYRVDKFLNTQALNNNGYIPISVILTFNRRKMFNATVEDVKKAVAGNSVVEISGDTIKKRETEEYLKYMMKNDFHRCVVYIDGLDRNMTLEDITALLSKYTEPLLIRMRRDKAKKFDGSVFVELKSEDEANKLINEKVMLDIKTETVDGKRVKSEKCLRIMSKEDYEKSKASMKSVKTEEQEKLEFISDTVAKLYKFEFEDDISIDEIKKGIADVAFVDLKNKIIRMKYVQDFETKELTLKDKKIVLTKMEENDALEYCNSVPFRVKPKSKKKKYRNK